MADSEQRLSPLNVKCHTEHPFFTNEPIESSGNKCDGKMSRVVTTEPYGCHIDKTHPKVIIPLDESSESTDEEYNVNEDKVKGMESVLGSLAHLSLSNDDSPASPAMSTMPPTTPFWQEQMSMKGVLANGSIYSTLSSTPPKTDTNGINAQSNFRRPITGHVSSQIGVQDVQESLKPYGYGGGSPSNPTFWCPPNQAHPLQGLRPPLCNATYPSNVLKRGQMSAPITPVVMPTFPMTKYNRSVSLPVQSTMPLPFRAQTPLDSTIEEQDFFAMQEKKVREMQDQAQVPSMDSHVPVFEMLKFADNVPPAAFANLNKGRLPFTRGSDISGLPGECPINAPDDQTVPNLLNSPGRLHLGMDRYSRKVFVGGLPPDIDEEEITMAFRRFGALVVDWPHKAESKSYFPPKGYCFLIFQDELSVHTLIAACYLDDNKLYWCVSSPTMRDKPVQIRPWNLSDSDFVMDGSQALDPRKTIFVGGVPRPLRAVELAMIMDRLYGDVCYAGIDTDPELKYPKGAGRVAFSSQQSYISAISARFVQLQLGDIDKRVEVKPYVLDDQMCDECGGTRCGGKFAPFFCANVTCLQYYCETCWTQIHARQGREFHKPLVKEGTDRPRTVPFRWL